MKSLLISFLALLILCTGCKDGQFGLRDKKEEFSRKIECSQAAKSTFDSRGEWFKGDETYIDQTFYSPSRNSCVAVFITTNGDLTPLSKGGMQDTLTDTYEIVDTLSHELIRTSISGTGQDRTRVMEEIKKETDGLKK